MRIFFQTLQILSWRDRVIALISQVMLFYIVYDIEYIQYNQDILNNDLALLWSKKYFQIVLACKEFLFICYNPYFYKGFKNLVVVCAVSSNYLFCFIKASFQTPFWKVLSSNLGNFVQKPADLYSIFWFSISKISII